MATWSSRGWTSTTGERRSNTRPAGGAEAEDRDGGEHRREEPDAPAPPAADHGPTLCTPGPAHRAAGGPAARHTLPDVASQRPVGTITRGTTNPNRLRRVRPLAGRARRRWRLRRPAAAPVVVDLGYGASPVTAVELHDRLRRVRARRPRSSGSRSTRRGCARRGRWSGTGLTFRLGGFEVPLPGGAAPTVVRAFNVLRQYDEDEVAGAWATVRERLAPDGLLVDGTCDELGRRSAWVAVDGRRPRSLSLSCGWRAASAPPTSPSGCPRR